MSFIKRLARALPKGLLGLTLVVRALAGDAVTNAPAPVPVTPRGSVHDVRKTVPAPNDLCEYQIYINAPPENVWEALTNPAIVPKYFHLQLTIEPKVGGKMNYGNTDNVLLTGTITKIQPRKLLEHDSTFVGGEGKPGQRTKVRYILKEMGGATWLIVQEQGYERDSQDYTEAAGGWAETMSGLKTLLETGITMGESRLIRRLIREVKR